MAGNLGRASLQLSTNGKGLNQGLSQSQRDAEKWAKKVEGAIRGTFKAVATAATAASAAMIAFARQGGETIEGMAKQARHAKSINLDVGLFGSIIEEAKDLGVAEGAVEAFFNRVASSGKDANAFILSSADLISGLSTEAEQAAKAEEIFGMKSLKLLPILQMGSKGIKEMVKHHQDLGLVLTSTTAEKAIAAFEQLDEAGDKLKGTWNNLVLSQTGLIVGMTKMTEMMASWANTSANKSALSTFFGWVGWAIGALVDNVNDMIAEAVTGISLIVHKLGGMSDNTWQGIQAQFIKQKADPHHYANLFYAEWSGMNEANRVKDPNAFKKPQQSKLFLDEDDLVIKPEKEKKKEEPAKMWDLIERMVNEREELADKIKTTIANPVQGFDAFSKEAADIENRFRFGQQEKDKTQKDILAELKKQNEHQKKVRELTQELLKELAKKGAFDVL